MGRPAKSVNIIKMEGLSHRTKKELPIERLVKKPSFPVRNSRKRTM